MIGRILLATIAVTSLGLSASCDKLGGGNIDKQIEQWVKDNPQVIMDALMDFQRRQHEMNQPQPEMVAEYKEELFESSSSPIAGNPEGKVQIAYFFDFNCGHCARQSETIGSVLGERDDVKIVYKNFPVLGPSSELAARAALAAHQQNKFKDYYEAVYNSRERSVEAFEGIAKELGLDIERWKKDLESEAVNAEIESTRQLAQNMKISGTPFMAIAPDKVFPGRVDELARVIESL